MISNVSNERFGVREAQPSWLGALKNRGWLEETKVL
jgi:hypothetical protein